MVAVLVARSRLSSQLLGLVLVVITYLPQGSFCSTAPRQVGLRMEQLREFEQFVFA
jgi:hypothetical protein